MSESLHVELLEAIEKTAPPEGWAARISGSGVRIRIHPGVPEFDRRVIARGQGPFGPLWAVAEDASEHTLPADPSDPDPEPPPLLLLMVPLPTEQVDEVGVDLGPDETGRGLLDRWNTTGTGTRSGSSTGAEATGTESTGVAAPIAGLDGGRGALLSSVLADAEQLLGDGTRFAATAGRPSARVKAQIADEPVEYLPLPDSIPVAEPHWSLHGDRLVEITAVRTSPFGLNEDEIPAPEVTARLEPPEITSTVAGLLERASVAPQIALGVIIGLIAAVAVLWWLPIHG